MPTDDVQDIVVHRDGNAVISPSPIGMNIGEKIRYSSPDGAVRIEFVENGSPFDETVVEDKQIVTATHAGHFRCRCSIILKDGTHIGWDTDKRSGADHDVPRT